MAQFAAIWSPVDGIVAKLLYGRSYRNPSFLELYGSIEDFLLPNPELRAETQDTISASVDTVVSDELALRLEAFYGATAEAILAEEVRVLQLQFVNVPMHIATGGTNLSVSWEVHPRLSLHASGTLQQTLVDERGYQHIAEATPKYLGSLRCTIHVLEAGGLRMTPSVRFRGPQSNGPADALIDLAVVWDVASGVSIIVAGRNLLDRYAHLPYDAGVSDAYLRRSRALRIAVSVDM